MKRTKLLLAAAMLMLSVGANAQFGSLKGLKDKVKKEAKNVTGDKAVKSVSDKAEATAATASLSDEQKWAINQLKTLSEAPPLPNLMKPEPNAKVPASMNFQTPQMIKDLSEGLYIPAQDAVTRTRGLLNSRLAYNMRVKYAIESLPNGLLPLDQDYKLRNRLDTLEYQVLLFQCLQQKVSDVMGLRFTDLNAKRDASGKMVMRDGGTVWPLPGGKTYFAVKKDKKDGKFKFYDQEKRAFVKINEDGVKDQQKFLKFLENGYTLLEQNEVTLKMYSSGDASIFLDNVDKCKIVQDAVKEALANN